MQVLDRLLPKEHNVVRASDAPQVNEDVNKAIKMSSSLTKVPNTAEEETTNIKTYKSQRREYEEKAEASFTSRSLETGSKVNHLGESKSWVWLFL